MQGFRKLLRYLWPYRKYVLLNVISNILMALFMVFSIPALIPFFQILFDREPPVIAKPEFSIGNLDEVIQYEFAQMMLTHTKTEALGMVCLLIISLFFFKNLFRYLSLFFMAIVRTSIVRDVRAQLFRKYLDLPFSFFSGERKGDLIARITTDIYEIESSILNVLEKTVKDPIVIIGSVAFMVYISPQLTVFVFVLILFTVFIIGGISRTLKRQSRIVQSKLGNLISIIEESLSGMRIIKGFNAEADQSVKFDLENDAYRSLLNRIIWRRDLSSPLSEFLGIAIVVILLWYGGQLVFKGNIQSEIFLVFLFAFYNVIGPAKSFSSAYFHIQKGLAAVERVNHILMVQNHIEDTEGAVPMSDFDRSITFHDVSFKYPENEEHVLKHIDLEIPKGRIYALVGASGAGKSTLVDLLPRFHDVLSGAIRIDGVDIRDIKIRDLRQMMGIVSQEAILFNDTIEHNIRFGTPDATHEQIVQAARYANAHAFIEETEHGYQTLIGDRGSKLSGGQRQRLTIARALLKNPPILILDEATASLDSESEVLVQQALQKVMKGRTSIVIAHRLSTIQNADMIVVLKNGEIVEKGTHEELLHADGEYHKFVSLQAF